MANVLDSLYHYIREPSSLGGVDKLWRAARVLDDKIKKRDVEAYLEGQNAYTLHKTTRERFPRRKIVAPRPRVIISCDLADMRKLSKYNHGYNYFLVCLDVFSRYLAIEVLLKKNSTSLLHALNKLLEREEFKGVSRIYVDRGGEFYNKKVQEYLKRKQIILYSVSSYEIKASLAERVIRTIKEKIFTYLTLNNTLKYVNILDEAVSSYNNSRHSSLDMTPLEVHGITDKEVIKKLFSRMYKTKAHSKKKNSTDLAVGATVRIVDSKKFATFRKGYTVQNTLEIFKVIRIDDRQFPKVYYLEDLAGEKIQGIFYRQELVPTTLPEVFPIHILRKKRVKGRLKYLVSWEGYPASFNSWIDARDVQ